MAILIEGDPKAPFSIAITPSGRGGRDSIRWISPLSHLIVLSGKQGGIKYHFLSLVRLDLGLNPGLLDHLRTLYSFGQWPSYANYLFLIGIQIRVDLRFIATKGFTTRKRYHQIQFRVITRRRSFWWM